MNIFRTQYGFTLIELLVVIAIIGVISSVALASLSTARDKARIARAHSDMHQLKTAMLLYLDTNGELPPEGDQCSGCTNPCAVDWMGVVDAMIADGSLNTPIYTDPWGNYYCYDDNYLVPACSYDTPLWTMGPNGNRDTTWGNGPPVTFAGDDFGIIVSTPQCSNS